MNSDFADFDLPAPLPPHRLPLAFVVGRLANRFRRRAFLLSFSSERPYLDAANGVLRNIEDVLSVIDQSRRGVAAAVSLRQLGEALERRCASEWWAEEYDYAFHHARFEPNGGIAAVWDSLSRIAESDSTHLERAIGLVLDGETEWTAYRLGQHVDSALHPVARPDNILRDRIVARAGVAQATASGDDAFGEPGRPILHDPVFAARHETEWSATAANEWIGELRRLWASLQLGETPILPVQWAVTVADLVDHTNLVNQASSRLQEAEAAASRDGLNENQAERDSAAPASGRRTGSRVTIEDDMILLDGRMVPTDMANGPRRNAIVMLQELIADFPNWVSSGDIRRRHPNFRDVRFDRVRNQLPAEIRELIEATSGRGYRLMD